MVVRETRPLTEEERRLLRPAGPPRTGFLATFILLVGTPTAALLLSAIPGKLFERFGMTSLIKPTMAVFTALGFALGLGLLMLGRARRRRAVEKPLEDGTCEVLHCTIEGAIEVEEFEDEGMGFFLDLGQGELLFLQGQYLYEPVEQGKFPSREFDVIRVPNVSGPVVLKIECRGEPLTPLGKRVPLTEAEYRTLPLEDGLVFRGRLQTLAADLERLRRS